MSLLRHTELIPADKAFYEAGLACKVGQLFHFTYNHGPQLVSVTDLAFFNIHPPVRAKKDYKLWVKLLHVV